MKVPVYDLDGKQVENIDLPNVFDYAHKTELIHRTVVAIQSNTYQPKGTDQFAGERTSASSYQTGQGISRPARVKRGTGPKAGTAAGVGSVVGGRVSHPPVSSKKIKKKVNKKERRYALLSTISASTDKEIVMARGHKIDDVSALPLVLTDDIESISKTRDLKNILLKLGLIDELSRISVSKKTSGKARLRGRTKKTRVGPIIVVSNNYGILSATKNLTGVDSKKAKDLSASDLAPGAKAGRLTIWSKSALENLPDVIYKMAN